MFSKKKKSSDKEKKKKKPFKKMMNLMKSWGHKMKKKPKENAAKPKIPIQITDNSPDLHWDETMFDVLKVWALDWFKRVNFPKMCGLVGRMSKIHNKVSN